MWSKDFRYGLGIWIAAGIITLDTLDQSVGQPPLIEKLQVILFVALTACLAYGSLRARRNAKRRKSTAKPHEEIRPE